MSAITPLPKPQRGDRVVARAERREAQRSSEVFNPDDLALPKPQVWHEPKYRAWAKKRFDCAIKSSPLHQCAPRLAAGTIKEFAHFEPEGKGLKCSDNRGVVLCLSAHVEQHQLGWQTFQAKHNFDRDATAREIFESSPWFGKVEVSW